MIEQADRPFASLSFGTTAEEPKEGESLDEHLREEQPSKTPLDRELAIEDFDDEEDELVATASIEQLFCISYCVPRLDEREEEGAINKRSAA